MDAALFAFDNSYARLPERFYARLAPTPVSDAHLVRVNAELARHLCLESDQLTSPVGVDILAGNRIPAGAEPLAMAYAGFQFGGWAPQLGDGRAILLGEVIDRHGGRRDIQLKGCGRTPYSRAGDGRAGLGPVLREYLVSEAMAALGIPTTRSLAAVTTGEFIQRESLLPGAVLTRVAQSHVRVGTFQLFSARQDIAALRALSNYVIVRHYPQVLESEQPCLALFDAVIGAQAELLAKWQLVGFIHGVMNTDNTSVAGETIDYGPCAFMDTYHPETVYSAIDHLGRYAYGNQPAIAHWNLAGLGQALLRLLDEKHEMALEKAQAAVNAFPVRFAAAYDAGARSKLGLEQARVEDAALMQDLLQCMADNHADFTLTFRRLCELGGATSAADGPVRSLFDDPVAFDGWAVRWRERLAGEARQEHQRQAAMRRVNPAFIPRNHLVEEAIQAAMADDDLGPFDALTRVLASPYLDQPACERWQAPPRPEQVVHQTFCGT